MEDRLSPGIYMEMTNLSATDYIEIRGRRLSVLDGVSQATAWNNLNYQREDYKSTDADFRTLALYEIANNFESPALEDGLRGFTFTRCPRPPQGSLSDKPTIGLLLCLVSPKTSKGKSALRDWADFVHINAIAAAGIEGYTMITAYENTQEMSPCFAHIYEMDCDEPEAAFQTMAPKTITRRLGEPGTQRYNAWFGHEELEINYINTFSLVRMKF